MEDSATNEFGSIFYLEKKLQNELDFEKFIALGEVSRYLKTCTSHLVINTLFLKLAQIFKDLPDVLKIELKEVLKECVSKFAFSMNINEFLNIFAQSLDSIDSLAKCLVIEIIQVFAPFCPERHDLFHKVVSANREVFDIYINTKMKYEKKVALGALRKMHADHLNFSKTLLKNMNSYLHTSSLTDDCFKKLVEVLPLSTDRMTMEILEIYLAILNKIANEVLLHAQKKSTSIKKRKRVPIMKIVLTSFLDCAVNYPILRDYVFSTVFSFCKKTMESKLELAAVLNNFLAVYLCKFAGSLDERCFKMSLDLFYTHSQDEKKLLRLLYVIHANFPTFFDGSRAIAYLKDKIRQIKFDTFDSNYLANSELYRIETFVEDLEAVNKNYAAVKKDHERLRNYLIFVNLFCFKKKVAASHAVPAASSQPGGETDCRRDHDVRQAVERQQLRAAAVVRDPRLVLLELFLRLRQETVVFRVGHS